MQHQRLALAIRRRAHAALLCSFSVFGALGASSSAIAAEGVPEDRAASEETTQDLDALRRRWAAKSEDERAELRARFRKLQELSAEDRELFLSMGRRVEDARRRWRSEGGGDDFEKELERRGRKLRERIHPPLFESLRRQPREQRPVMLERELRKLRRDGRLLERFGERMGLSPSEIEALRNLPAEERKKQLAALRRTHWTKRLQSMEATPNVDSMSDEELLERLRKARRRRLERAKAKAGETRDPRDR